MKNLVFVLMLFLFYTSLYSLEKLENISTKSAVIFNTLCSKCHEGECSGRLSFDTGSKAASSHIKRYSNSKNISKDEIKEFFTLLNYMKKECLLYMPEDKTYKTESLSFFSIDSHKKYFIPLGFLKRGNYTLKVKSKEDIHFRVEIISNEFNSFLDDSFCPSVKGKLFDFSIDEDKKYYLRIQSKKPLHLNILKIKKK